MFSVGTHIDRDLPGPEGHDHSECALLLSRRPSFQIVVIKITLLLLTFPLALLDDQQCTFVRLLKNLLGVIQYLDFVQPYNKHAI